MAGYDGTVQLIVITAEDRSRLAALVELADEMMEDPQCQVVIPAVDGDTAMVVSVWPDAMAPAVHTGLSESGWDARRFTILE